LEEKPKGGAKQETAMHSKKCIACQNEKFIVIQDGTVESEINALQSEQVSSRS